MPISSDGSVTDKNGRLAFCSWKRFVADICEGDHCFICDRTEQEVDFNREHILPNWMLGQFGLHCKSVTLPNRTRHLYGNYTVACCTECNDELGRVFETPISQAFANGFQGVHALVERDGPMKLFQWMALIFLKLHLKDRRLRKHRNLQHSDAPISETYEWPTFHHLHSLARAHHAGAAIGDFVLGSMILMEIEPDPEEEAFDVTSITDAFTLYLRTGDLALYAVFNDGHACAGAIDPVLQRLTGILNPLQARELAAELAAANMHVENRPSYRTLMSDADGADLQIIGEGDAASPRFVDKDHDVVGFYKHFLLQHAVRNVAGRTADESSGLLRQNRLSFLFDDKGEFITEGKQSWPAFAARNRSPDQSGTSGPAGSSSACSARRRATLSR